jgi:hypothetical protein
MGEGTQTLRDMMNLNDWEAASKRYQAKLEHALRVQRHALDVARMPEANTSRAVIDRLEREREPLARQLQRLRKGEFRIAVVGLENAGKSTFINAWLDYELLPSRSSRCTFTTTRIQSIEHDDDQRLEVTTKSREEFDRLLEELRDVAANAEGDRATRAREDLQTIEDNRSRLDEVVGRTIEPTSFDEFTDIENELRKYVADEGYAHAVREVRLYTNKLVSTGGIVFFDVPGLNSGLQKHIDESRQMLQDCDGVICVKPCGSPSLTAGEKKLIDFVRQGEVSSLDIGSKLFVFLNKAELEGSSTSRQDNVELAVEKWKRQGLRNASRIVAGSAGASLVLRGTASEETCKKVGDPETVAHRMSDAFGVAANADASELLSLTGMGELQDRIEDYLQDERVQVLRQRCDRPIQRILDAAQEVYRKTRKSFPEDPEEARNQALREQRKLFEKWWEDQWLGMRASLEGYFRREVEGELYAHEADEADGDFETSVDRLRQRYSELVEHGLKRLQYRQSAKREELFNALRVRGAYNEATINEMWRERLYSDITTLIERIAEQLSMELLEEAQNLVAAMTELLWNESDVRDELLESPERFRGELQIGLKTLFLRFARPVINALIFAPRGTMKRKRVLEKLGRDVTLLDPYHRGDGGGNDELYAHLLSFAMYGEQLVQSKKAKGILSKIAEYGLKETASPAAVVQLFSEVKDVTPRHARSLEEVIIEVENDLAAAQAYLLDSVFQAAGFAEYRLQELARLRDQFVDGEPTWRAVAKSAWHERNPRLLAALPGNLRNREIDLEINERLGEFKEALGAPTITTEVSPASTASSERSAEMETAVAS